MPETTIETLTIGLSIFSDHHHPGRCQYALVNVIAALRKPQKTPGAIQSVQVWPSPESHCQSGGIGKFSCVANFDRLTKMAGKNQATRPRLLPAKGFVPEPSL